MSNMGCCGMDCDNCEAKKATERKDNITLAKLAVSAEQSGAESFILPSRMRCTGCLTSGAKSLSCNECKIRQCAMENQIPHCGFCEEFPCELGSIVWEAVPEYKHNIERIKSR
ncbi:MAG: DUF3795 domain-containing protein [Synergistaceae bacterium]